MPAPRRRVRQEGDYPAARVPGDPSRDQLQRFFLARLKHLVYVKNKYDLGRMGGGWLLMALNRAIYTTLRDCVEVGAGEQAKALLRQEHQPN